VSQENVEVVLRFESAGLDVDLVNLLGDDHMWAAVTEATAPFFHPDAETVFPTVPGGRIYTGSDGFRACMLDWLAPWATHRAESEEIIDCGDPVVTLRRAFGRLEGSAEEVALTSANVYTFRGGKVARIEGYADRDQALKAVGLEE
jgi:ketosteroid isomerase-like protein